MAGFGHPLTEASHFFEADDENVDFGGVESVAGEGWLESGSAIVRIVKDSITAGRIFCGIRISRIGWEDN